MSKCCIIEFHILMSALFWKMSNPLLNQLIFFSNLLPYDIYFFIIPLMPQCHFRNIFHLKAYFGLIILASNKSIIGKIFKSQILIRTQTTTFLKTSFKSIIFKKAYRFGHLQQHISSFAPKRWKTFFLSHVNRCFRLTLSII